MGEPDEGRGETRVGWQRGLLGALLCGVGLCVGVVIGSVMDGPRVLLRRLQEPTLGVELEELGERSAEQEELEEFRRLQEPVATQAGRPVVAPKPDPPAVAAARVPEPPSRTPPPEAESEEGPGTSDTAPAAPELPAPAAATPRPADAAPAPTEREPPRRETPPQGAPPPAAPARAAAKPAPPDKETLLRAMAERVGARPEAETATSTPPAAGSPVIQVAAYADRSAADALAVRLRRDGHDAYVSSSNGDGEVRYRVRVRPGNHDADAIAKRLGSAGFNVWIARE